MAHLAASLLGACAAYVAPLHAGAAVRGRSITMAVKSPSVPFLDKPEALDGSMAGDVGFDPLGLSNEGPQRLTWYREAELKHGRIAMLAVVGWFAVDLGLHFPGADYEGLTSLTAHDAMVASGNMWVLLMGVGILEIMGGIALYEQSMGSGREAGDYSFDPLNFASDPAKMADLKVKEVKNGRLAMLAFSGIVTQAALTGKGFPYY